MKVTHSLDPQVQYCVKESKYHQLFWGRCYWRHLKHDGGDNKFLQNVSSIFILWQTLNNNREILTQTKQNDTDKPLNSAIDQPSHKLNISQ
jgi:hypothetical protein